MVLLLIVLCTSSSTSTSSNVLAITRMYNSSTEDKMEFCYIISPDRTETNGLCKSGTLGLCFNINTIIKSTYDVGQVAEFGLNHSERYINKPH